jgi:FAD-dependent halogenase
LVRNLEAFDQCRNKEVNDEVGIYMEDSRSQYDVIVIGGGPAGSTASTFIAMQGFRVLLLEKYKFPVYKIGESLLPATVQGICPMLGVDRALGQANFVVKRGGTFKWGKASEPWTFSFASSSRLNSRYNTAYQVERMKFDLILLNNARAKGVDVRENCSVRQLIKSKNRVSGVEYVDHLGSERRCFSRYVIDASGHQSTLAKEAGARRYSEFFQNVALFGYFDGGKRLPEPNRGNILSEAFDLGWFWYIPLSESLTSVGAVIGKEHAVHLGKNLDGAFRDLICSCPLIKSMLENATRINTGPYGELRMRTDYSYCNERFWADGLVLIGDAACFVDPVFSSGVHLATYSALQAARSVNTRLSGKLSDDVCFTEFERRYRREYSHFYNFLVAFYDVNEDAQSYFWKARKVTNSMETESDAFINLVSGIETKERLGPYLFPGATSAECNEDGKIRSGSFLKDLLGEIVQIQLQALSGSCRPIERPLFPGGLVPSRDGLSWTREPGYLRMRSLRS